MKKTLMFASCLLAAVAFTACSDDDNNNDGGNGNDITNQTPIFTKL